MTTITMGANTGNTGNMSLAVPPANFCYFRRQQVCPRAEPASLAQAGPAERHLKIRLMRTAYPGKGRPWYTKVSFLKFDFMCYRYLIFRQPRFSSFSAEATWAKGLPAMTIGTLRPA